MSAQVRKLGKMIFGGYLVAALYLALAVIMMVAAFQGGGLGAVLVPWATGLLLGAVLSGGVAARTSSLRRALRAEGRGSWGPAEITARVRALDALWLAALAATAAVGVGTLLIHEGSDRPLAGIGALMGLVVQIQPRTLLWSATRTLTDFAREVAAESGRPWNPPHPP